MDPGSGEDDEQTFEPGGSVCGHLDETYVLRANVERTEKFDVLDCSA